MMLRRIGFLFRQMNRISRVLGRRVYGVEFQLIRACGVNHIVLRPRWNNRRSPIRELRYFSINDYFHFPFFDAEKLVVRRVHFHSNFLIGKQRHGHELLVNPGEQHAPKRGVFQRHFLNISYKPLHANHLREQSTPI